MLSSSKHDKNVYQYTLFTPTLPIDISRNSNKSQKYSRTNNEIMDKNIDLDMDRTKDLNKKTTINSHSYQLTVNLFNPDNSSPPNNWTTRLMTRVYGTCQKIYNNKL